MQVCIILQLSSLKHLNFLGINTCLEIQGNYVVAQSSLEELRTGRQGSICVLRTPPREAELAESPSYRTPLALLNSVLIYYLVLGFV